MRFYYLKIASLRIKVKKLHLKVVYKRKLLLIYELNNIPLTLKFFQYC